LIVEEEEDDEEGEDRPRGEVDVLEKGEVEDGCVAEGAKDGDKFKGEGGLLGGSG
jgi:hypothetical protein